MAATLGPSSCSFSGHRYIRRSYLFNLKPPSFSSPGGPESLPDPLVSTGAGPSPASVDPVKLAFERAKAYKNTSRLQHQPPARDAVVPETAGDSPITSYGANEVGHGKFRPFRVLVN